jgi:hypothetical protein
MASPSAMFQVLQLRHETNRGARHVRHPGRLWRLVLGSRGDLARGLQAGLRISCLHEVGEGSCLLRDSFSSTRVADVRCQRPADHVRAKPPSSEHRHVDSTLQALPSEVVLCTS